MPGDYIDNYLDQVGRGWHGLLTELDGLLRQADPDYRVAQVKEKFGMLRVYLHTYTSGTDEIIARFERASASICEDCGSPGRLRTSRVWVRTLCDQCEPPRLRGGRMPQGEDTADG